MRFRLRTLMIVLALGPPVLAGAWFLPRIAAERYRQWQFDQLVELITTTVRPHSGWEIEKTDAVKETSVDE